MSILERMAAMRARKGCVVKMSDFNPKCLVMGRQYRGLTRKELSEKCCLNIQEIRRMEKKIDVFDLQRMKLLADTLSFPIDFFKQGDPPARKATVFMCNTSLDHYFEEDD